MLKKESLQAKNQKSYDSSVVILEQTKTDLTIDQRIREVFDLFVKHGEMNYVGENVTQMQHAQQVSFKLPLPRKSI